MRFDLRILATFLLCLMAPVFGAVPGAPGPVFIGALPPPVTGCAVLFSDFVSAPVTGGENNAGSYVTVIGQSIPASSHVLVGGQPVTERWRGAAKRPGLTAVTFQPAGKSGAITIEACTGSTPFSAQSGRVLFVSLIGNDTTAIPGDITKPYRHAQTSNRGGAYGALKAGDVMVLRGGTWTDVGYDNRFLRMRDANGTAAGYLGITAYPGETVTINSAASGGIHGRSDSYSDGGDYVVISNLNFVGGSTAVDGPLNLQTDSDYWRVVNNDVGPWTPKTAKAGGITGNGIGLFIAGNHVHDISGGTENHGMYWDTGARGRIAYNLVERVGQGNLLQSFDNLGMSNGWLSLEIDHNDFLDGGRYGLNIADSTRVANVHDNIVKGTAYSALRINLSDPLTDLWVHDNTFSDTNRVKYGGMGAINCDWQLTKAVRALIERNKVTPGANAESLYVQQGDCPALKFSP